MTFFSRNPPHKATVTLKRPGFDPIRNDIRMSGRQGGERGGLGNPHLIFCLCGGHWCGKC